jgi:hypothetical protein
MIDKSLRGQHLSDYADMPGRERTALEGQRETPRHNPKIGIMDQFVEPASVILFDRREEFRRWQCDPIGQCAVKCFRSSVLNSGAFGIQPIISAHALIGVCSCVSTLGSLSSTACGSSHCSRLKTR